MNFKFLSLSLSHTCLLTRSVSNRFNDVLCLFKVEELRNRLEEKNRLIEKKTQGVLQQQQERNRTVTELSEMKEHMDIKDRKINVLQRKIENLEDLLKEKDNQVDMARARLTAMQAHHCSSEGALTSLEEAIGDKEKQMSMLR